MPSGSMLTLWSAVLTSAGRSASSNVLVLAVSGRLVARAAIRPFGSVMRISRCSLAGVTLVSISKMRLPLKKASSMA